MKVLITGGAGFLGMRLARALCELGSLSTSDGQQQAIEQIVLFDHVSADLRGQDERIRSVVGDVSDPDPIAQAIGDGVHSIFHLAAVVSGQANKTLIWACGSMWMPRAGCWRRLERPSASLG